jgi:hypothetical protein
MGLLLRPSAAARKNLSKLNFHSPCTMVVSSELTLFIHTLKTHNAMKKNNSIWEVLLRIVIAAATAALTALGTTSCMGYGPFNSLA